MIKRLDLLLSFNATVNVIEGQEGLMLEKQEIILESGVFVFIPAAHHTVRAATNLAFLLILSGQAANSR